MDAITSDVLSKLIEMYPRASIRLTHQFLDGSVGKGCGVVPADWDGESVVVVTGQWWRPANNMLSGAAGVRVEGTVMQQAED
jgi:hypothetical protein